MVLLLPNYHFMVPLPNRQCMAALLPLNRQCMATLLPLNRQFMATLLPLNRQCLAALLHPNRQCMATLLPLNRQFMATLLPLNRQCMATLLPLNRQFMATLLPLNRQSMAALLPLNRLFMASLLPYQHQFMVVLLPLNHLLLVELSLTHCLFMPITVYAEPFVFNSPIYGGPPASYKSNDGPPTTQPHPVCSGPSKLHQPVLVNPLTPSVSIGGPPRTQSDPVSSHPSSSPTPQIILEKTSPTTSLTPVGGPSPSQPKSVNGDPLPTQSSLPGGPSVRHVDTSGGAPVMMSGGSPVVQEHKSAHCSYSNPRLNQQSHQLQSGSYLSQDEFPILGTKNSKQIPPAHVNFQPTKSSHAENSPQPPCNSIISYAGKTSMKINEVVVKKEQGIILYTLNSDLCTKIPNIQLIKAVGEKVGPKNVISASRISNGRFCMFLKSEEIAKSFVYFNPQLKINNQNVNVRLYANSAEKLIISNVSTPIPNSILETVLRSHMDIEIMSPIHHMNYGIIDKDYSHLTNFRRYVFIKYDAEVTTIPESLVFDYDKLSYQIYLTIESNKCRLCPDEIHSAKKCPKVQKQNISERLPKPLEPTDQQSNNSDDANTLKPVPTDQIQIQVHAENQPMVETVQESITENITEEQPELSSKRKQSEDNTPVESEVEFEVIAKKSKGKKKTKKNTEQESSNSQRSALTLKDFMVDKGPANRTPLKYQEYKDIMDPLKSIFEDLNKQSSEKLSINSGDVINLLEDCKHSRNKLKIVEAFNVNKEKLQYILNELSYYRQIQNYEYSTLDCLFD
ncbi:hypothetical protein M8J76_010404 [Diaphorina citri]|nr:hypothetical protein M8J76_010404 [Diaphorina citri]